MSTVDLPNIREPFIDQRTGLISRAWWIWLQQLMTRIGGSGGTDITALETLVTALIAASRVQEQEIAGFVPLPPDADDRADEGMVYVPPQDLAATSPVQSVFGRTGTVTAQSGDYTVAQVTNAASVLATLAQFAATTSAQLAGVLSDETGTGSAVFGSQPTLNQPNIVGTITNDNAAAGSVGEFVTNTGSASATSGVLTNTTSTSLTAGDWDVTGGILFAGSGGTAITNQAAGVSTTSTTLGAAGTFVQLLSSGMGTDTTFGGPVPMQRISIAATTTVYLVSYVQFTGGSVTVTGEINARRVR